MIALRFDDVTISAGGRRILEDVSATIRSGEFVGVLGPNGAGKTTLMRAVLGLVRPAAGRIEVVERPIGYLPQVRVSTAAGRICGFDLLASGLGAARFGLPWISRAQRDEIGRALALVDAEALAERPIGSLSGGERQRLLLAQALLGRPRMLLLDEPLGGLDPRRQHQVLGLIRRLQQELGLTVLMSAHELNAVIGIVDRVLYLGGGHAALGAVDEVVTSPVLSRLYGAPIDVVRAGGRIFVTQGARADDRVAAE